MYVKEYRKVNTMIAKTISQTFDDAGHRTANVCYQYGQWVVMLYENNEYLRSVTAQNEDEADDIADDWVL